jgi:hypothetical protein
MPRRKQAKMNIHEITKIAATKNARPQLKGSKRVWATRPFGNTLKGFVALYRKGHSEGPLK